MIITTVVNLDDNVEENDVITAAMETINISGKIAVMCLIYNCTLIIIFISLAVRGLFSYHSQCLHYMFHCFMTLFQGKE